MLLRLLAPVVKALDELQARGLESRPAEVAHSAAWRSLIRTLGPREVLGLVPFNLSESASGRWAAVKFSSSPVFFH